MQLHGLEVCANSLESAIAAQTGGAVRIELCENMAEGGTTPSYGTIKTTLEKVRIPVWPIVRPRGGDFLYTDYEFEVMKADINMMKDLGCDGVVFGILTAEGNIDLDRCRTLVDLANPLPSAFHRAFDMCVNLELALFDLINLGFKRVLTSGGAENAVTGIENLRKLVELSASQIEIMPGAGIRADNIATIRNFTGAHVFHASARTLMPSKMTFRNLASNMGGERNEFEIEQTSAVVVGKIVEALNSA